MKYSSFLLIYGNTQVKWLRDNKKSCFYSTRIIWHTKQCHLCMKVMLHLAWSCVYILLYDLCSWKINSQIRFIQDKMTAKVIIINFTSINSSWPSFYNSFVSFLLLLFSLSMIACTIARIFRYETSICRKSRYWSKGQKYWGCGF